ncbi:ATP-binding protein [Cohnella sp. LGH]|uniref:ATP-binding protein n=1 Tax=Cohnella sp. LGH TaxID=1619153 RepID=UPI001FFE0A08|nr:ATP-binding protein [Cohnella sp. LGH]
MSIKVKLSLLISLIATIILALNISIYYYSSKNEMENSLRQEMLTIAKQIGTNLDAAEKSMRLMESIIGEKLRTVAISAQSALDPRIENVGNEQLAELSRKLGVDHISLWKRGDGDIKVFRSSDPMELNMGSKTMDYWYRAFNQLLDDRQVTIEQGQKLDHYWSGPYQYASSDPDRVHKWGYYYDGTTDYIINPYVNAQVFLDYENKIGTNALIRSVMSGNEGILAITGFDPKFFGKPEIVKLKKGRPVRNLDVRDVPFGIYAYADKEQDVEFVLRAAGTGEVSTARFKIDGKEVIKSFIPLQNEKHYVVSVIFDYGSIKEALNRQLFLLMFISAGLLVLVWTTSYFISGAMIRPLRHIVDYVNEIAVGRFGRKIETRARDELGTLSLRVNAMADNLQTYMGKLQDSAEELRSTKEYLESFVNHTSDAILVTDLQGAVKQANQAFGAIYGWNPEDVLGREPSIIPDELKPENEAIRVRVATGESVTGFETVRLARDGSRIDVSITVSPIRNDRGEVVAIAEISRNITARKQTEEVIRRTEKLSVIGQLAAGVAHEIRNPLTTLRGFVQLGQKQGSLSNAYLDIMLPELERINMIVSEFLVLSKPQISQFRPTELSELLCDLISLLEPQASLVNVHFRTSFADNVPPIVCDGNQLKQVFMNVIKNSLEAMEENGGEIAIDLSCDGANAVIRVADQGRGIAKEHLTRLGEPFFTSKASGNGLGLMVSQRIIANHKGKMSFSSKPGIGTCVEIRLPVIA